MIFQMQNRLIGTVVIILGLLLILTPWWIFPVCGKGRYAPKIGTIKTPHKCTNTLYAESALGIITLALGVAALARPSRKSVFTVSCLLMAVAILVSLFPLWLTGVCKMSTMPCRTGALPALVTISVMMAVTAVSGMVQAKNLK